MPATNRVRKERMQPHSISYLPGFLPQVPHPHLNPLTYFDYIRATRWRQPRLHALQPAHPAARLRPTGDGDKVQVMWWRGTTWAAPGDFGPVVIPLDRALQFIATEGFFWINA